MADSVNNPGDSAEFGRLNKALEGVVQSLRGELAQARSLTSQAAEDRKETRKQAQREAVERRTATEAASARQIERAAKSLPTRPGAGARLTPEDVVRAAERVQAASTPAQGNIERQIEQAGRNVQRTARPIPTPLSQESIAKIAAAVNAAGGTPTTRDTRVPARPRIGPPTRDQVVGELRAGGATGRLLQGAVRDALKVSFAEAGAIIDKFESDLRRKAVRTPNQYLQPVGPLREAEARGAVQAEADRTSAGLLERSERERAAGNFQVADELRRQARQIQRVVDAQGAGVGGGAPPTGTRPTATGGAEPPPRSAYQLPGGGISLDAVRAADDEAEALKRAEDRARTLQGAHRALSTSAGELELALAGEARGSQLAGDQMRRHGLLTTEFINAAARGRTTVRELGVQIGGTIAKFAGWTTAAALTYGGLAAVQQLGSGALDSLEGVNQLQRVVSNLDTTKAQQQFRELASEFNLPIGVVTDAAFEASKAFKDQGQILDATRAALQGVKVGELEAGASGKYATAIVRGFKLETSDLGRVLDVVNRLQNQFGGDFGQIFQGVAGAAGSFANAKGTFEELAALIQTGQQVTGKTGNELATALRRSAEIVLRPERRAKIIDLLGIDPADTSITDVIRAAQRAYAEDPGNAQLLQQLATTISTPELASGRIAPLIRSGELFEQRLADVQANATGSAEKERQRVLKSAREQIKELTNQLQELGSALAQAGAGEGLGAVVQGIDLAEESAIKLVEALSLIPKPLREAALAAAPFLATIALLRRFDAGQVLAGRGGLTGALGTQLSRDPRARGRAQLLQGLDDEKVYLQSRGERARFRSADLALSTVRSRDRLAEATRYFESLDDTADDYADAQRRVNVLSVRHQRLLDEGIEAVEDADDIERRIIDNRRIEAQARTRTSRRGGRQDPYVVGRDLGIPYASSIDPRPNQAGLIPTRDLRTLTAAEIAATQTAASGARNRTQAARLRAGRVASSVGIEGAILGAFGIYEFSRFISEKQREAEAEVKRLQNLPRTAKDAADLRRQAEEALGPEHSLARVFTARAAAAGIPGPKAATEALGQADRLARLQAQGRAFTLAQTQAQLTQDLANAGGDEKAARNALARARRQALSARGLLFAKTPEERAHAEELIRVFIEQVLNPRLASLSDFAETFDSLLEEATEPAQLADLLSGVTTRTATRGSSRKLASQAGRIAARARALLAETTEPEQEAALIELSEQAEQQALSAAQQRLETALALATGPRASRAARQRYLGEARAALITPFRRDIGNIRDRIEERQERIRSTRATPLFPGGLPTGPQLLQPIDPGGGARAALARRQAAIAALRVANRVDREKLKELTRGLNLNRAQFNVLVREVAQAQAQERLERFDARTDRLQSEAGTDQDGAEVVAKRLRERVQIVRDLVAKKVLTSADLDRAIAESNNAEKAAAEDLRSKALELLKARQALTLATLGASGASEGTLLKTALSQTQVVAQKTLGQKGRGSVEYLQAATDVANAQKALNEYLRQQAQDLISARAELAVSRTTNPVTQATIQLRRDQQLIRYARTPAERIRLQAQINNDRRGVSTARTEQAADDIQFQLDMDRIDEQTAARRFRALARAVKNNKELKRDLLRRAKALSGDDSTELELTPGNVRLPTLTEIRRYRQGLDRQPATAGHVTSVRERTTIDARRNSVVHNRNIINLQIQKGAEDKVFDALEKALGDVKVTARARRPG